jgi:hypothetical protein
MKVVLTIATFLFSPVNREPLYLDPGSGSFLIQLIIAGALGAGFVIKASWGKIKAFFTRTSSEPVEEDQEVPQDE